MNPGGRRNGVWGIAQQVAMMGSTTITALLLAQNYSLEQFGSFTFAASMLSLGNALTVAGLQGLAIREFANRERSARSLTRSLTQIRSWSAIGLYLALASIAYATGDSGVLVATLIVAIALAGKILDAPELYFQSILRNDISAKVRIVGALVFLLVRWLLIEDAATFELVLATLVLEQVLVGLTLRVLFRKSTLGEPLAVQSGSTLALAQQAFPLLASAFVNQAGLRLPLVVVQFLAGSSAVAIFGAGTRVVDLAIALPAAYMAATMPIMLAAHRERGPSFKQFVQSSLDRAAWLGVSVGAVVFLTAEPLLTSLFGPEYAAGATALQIMSASLPFLFLSSVVSKWIVVVDLLWLSLFRHGLGLGVNIVGCFLLVPSFGIEGAAASLTVSIIVAHYLFAFVDKRSRSIALMMTSALACPWRLFRGVI